MMMMSMTMMIMMIIMMYDDGVSECMMMIFDRYGGAVN
jgi:hypothetical protein